MALLGSAGDREVSAKELQRPERRPSLIELLQGQYYADHQRAHDTELDARTAVQAAHAARAAGDFSVDHAKAFETQARVFREARHALRTLPGASEAPSMIEHLKLSHELQCVLAITRRCETQIWRAKTTAENAVTAIEAGDASANSSATVTQVFKELGAVVQLAARARTAAAADAAGASNAVRSQLTVLEDRALLLQCEADVLKYALCARLEHAASNRFQQELHQAIQSPGVAQSRRQELIQATREATASALKYADGANTKAEAVPKAIEKVKAPADDPTRARLESERAAAQAFWSQSGPAQALEKRKQALDAR